MEPVATLPIWTQWAVAISGVLATAFTAATFTVALIALSGWKKRLRAEAAHGLLRELHEITDFFLAEYIGTLRSGRLLRAYAAWLRNDLVVLDSDEEWIEHYATEEEKRKIQKLQFDEKITRLEQQWDFLENAQKTPLSRFQFQRLLDLQHSLFLLEHDDIHPDCINGERRKFLDELFGSSEQLTSQIQAIIRKS